MEARARTARAGTTPTRAGTTRAVKRDRQRAVRELVTRQPVASQQELVELLATRGFDVTQATVSRDIAELGLVKVALGGRHVYASPDDLGAAPPLGDDVRLRRILSDYPVRLGRSGLTLLVVSEAGTAGAIAQAIDESTLQEQEGTLAGDDTVLVLFADESQLRRWQERFASITTSPTLAEAYP